MPTQPDFFQSTLWLTRLQEQDAIAFEELWYHALPVLFHWAQQKHPDLRRDDIEPIIHDILLYFFRNTKRYDPSKSQLMTYLINLLKLRLLDAYTSVNRERDNLELDNPENSENPPYNIIVFPSETGDKARHRLFQEVLATLNPLEQAVLTLRLQEVKSLEAYIAVFQEYGVAQPTRREIKNMKARLDTRVRQVAKQLGYDHDELLDQPLS